MSLTSLLFFMALIIVTKIAFYFHGLESNLGKTNKIDHSNYIAKKKIRKKVRKKKKSDSNIISEPLFYINDKIKTKENRVATLKSKEEIILLTLGNSIHTEVGKMIDVFNKVIDLKCHLYGGFENEEEVVLLMPGDSIHTEVGKMIDIFNKVIDLKGLPYNDRNKYRINNHLKRAVDSNNNNISYSPPVKKASYSYRPKKKTYNPEKDYGPYKDKDGSYLNQYDEKIIHEDAYFEAANSDKYNYNKKINKFKDYKKWKPTSKNIDSSKKKPIYYKKDGEYFTPSGEKIKYIGAYYNAVKKKRTLGSSLYN